MQTLVTPYADVIAVYTDANPRHVEAYMRVQHGTLDALGPNEFKREVSIAVACINEGGTDMAERIAQSYGF